MPHVPDEHQRPPLHDDLAPVRPGVDEVGRQPPRDLAPALHEGVGKIAPHQPQPVAVGQHLVGGVHAGDRILAVHDGRHGRFQPHVGQPRLVPRPDGRGAVEHQLHMKRVVLQKHRLRRARMPAPAHELRGLHQRLVVHQKLPAPHMVAPRVGVARPLDRERLVQEHPRPRDHPRAPAPVIAAGRGRAPHRVGAVERVIKAPPPRVRGVERIARVRDRHDELRPRHGGDLGVDVARVDLERLALGQEIADLLEEPLVRLVVVRRVAVADVPGVDLRLKLVPPGQQRPVARSAVLHQPREARPEVRLRHPRPRKRLRLHEIRQLAGDLQPGTIDTLGHRGLLPALRYTAAYGTGTT
jgi:hypothetical protein